MSETTIRDISPEDVVDVQMIDEDAAPAERLECAIDELRDSVEEQTATQRELRAELAKLNDTIGKLAAKVAMGSAIKNLFKGGR